MKTSLTDRQRERGIKLENNKEHAVWSKLATTVSKKVIYICIQECSRSSAVKEGGARRQSVEKL